MSGKQIKNKGIMKNEKEEILTKKEKKIEKLLNAKYDTKYGKKSVSELNLLVGVPMIVLSLAKIEVKTGSTSKPTAIVTREVGSYFKYKDGTCIRDISKSNMLVMPYEGITEEKVRHPNFNPEKMPKIKESERKLINLKS